MIRASTPTARWQGWLRYVAAIVLAAFAALVRLGFLQSLGTRNVYLTFYPAVMWRPFTGALGGPAGGCYFRRPG